MSADRRRELRDAVADLVRVQTDFERSLVDWVVLWDEYELVHRRFAPDDVVVDIGAHVGVFSALVHVLGGRAIHAFEPRPDSFTRLSELGRRLAGIATDPRAVVRSDDPPASLSISGGIGSNTGSVSTLFGGRGFDVDAQALVDGEPDGRRLVEVDTIDLDSILRSLGRVSLLKLDCEGSEFPILLTSSELGRVEEIVGEYHVVAPDLYSALDESGRVGTLTSYRPEWLAVRLQSCGFEVELRPHSESIGWFRALRR